MPLSPIKIKTRWRSVRITRRLWIFVRVRQVRKIGWVRYPWTLRWTDSQTRRVWRLAW
jgi:hypothetical protein